MKLESDKTYRVSSSMSWEASSLNSIYIKLSVALRLTKESLLLRGINTPLTELNLKLNAVKSGAINIRVKLVESSLSLLEIVVHRHFLEARYVNSKDYYLE